VVVNEFPTASETFVVSHVEALLARGHHVTVVPLVPRKVGREFSQRVLDVVARTAAHPDPYPAKTFGKVLLLARLLVTGGPRVWAFALTRKPVAPGGFAWRVLFAARVRSAATADVVHAHFGFGGLAAAEMRRRRFFSAPLVVTFHGRDALVHGRRHPGLYEPLRDAAAITATTEFMRGVVAGLGLPVDHIRLWPMGVDTNSFTPAITREDENAGVFNVISVGRLVPFKGHDVNLRVIAAVRARVPNVHYTVVGDGDLRADLEQLADELGIADITTFAGVQTHEQTLARLRGADVCLHMGRVADDGSVEAQGVAPAEASACGLPVVTTRVGGLPEVVLDGETGVVVDALDVEAGADALFRLAADARLRSRLGAAGRAHIERTLSREVSTDLIEAIYRAVVG
jgi:colanic acid/amylovoran biosynthesis glycosyltransferase